MLGTITRSRVLAAGAVLAGSGLLFATVLSEEGLTREGRVSCYSAAAYPGDGASRVQLARWLGAAARAAGLPPELPVMAALVESDLRPSDHGSVGLFQQQVGGAANTREYKGYATRPELQVKWFIESAIAVKMQRYARGIDVRADPRLWGEWIADVERPARQFRGRYQLRLDEARRLLSGAAR